jgi:L-rhamnose-H+ transport protein
VYSLSAFIFCPIVLALFFSPGMFTEVLKSHEHYALQVGLYGLLFGVGCVLFGVCWARLGIAVATALVSGIIVLVGSGGSILVGTIHLDRNGWIRLILGVIPLMASLGLSTIATIGRDRAQRVARSEAASLKQSMVGIALSLLSGMLSAMLNVGIAVGDPLETLATYQGYTPYSATLTVWVPLLVGGFVANFAYPIFLVHRHRTWPTFFNLSNSFELWLRSFAMGALWFGAIFLYGYGAWVMGYGGTVYGWAMVSGGGVLGSCIVGVFAGEWSKAGPKPKLQMASAVVLMLLSFWILAAA